MRKIENYTNSKIQIINKIPDNIKITHAIFDHDGTISTLRQGWEKVMESFMMMCILGDKFNSIDDNKYNSILKRVKDFINQTTGMQTLIQMQGLLEFVKEYNFVPKNQILNIFEYKELYNNLLIKKVSIRRSKLLKNDISVDDLTIKNAIYFLNKLQTAGIKMYLASGTDENDVRSEAALLGYAHLFKGGIFGSVGDINKDSKKIVIETIISEISKERISNLICFGDGPVEIFETHKAGGITVGVASNEINRKGLNSVKAIRLINAGADIIISDYLCADKLLDLLNIK